MTARSSYPKGVAKREEILRVTLEVFGREGERNTTLRTVAKESRISLTGLMHYFESKDHLLTEVLRASDRAAEARFHDPEAVREREAVRDPGEFLARALTVNAAHSARVRLYVTLAAASTDPAHPAHTYFRDRFALLRATITEHLTAEQRAGRVSSGLDPHFIASALVAASDGIQLQWLSDPGIDMADHVRRVWRTLLAAPTPPIAARPPA
ncbi:TetR/AcrR family transcriptional regulator [Streptomyces sp. VRA16 Mangrove soil]|uniref:TetR/AcrR family transcriptional regulator n=1 Tax=Streptomyces sp. VRA16 Mangrove soil TaxID=2817434 RepID=UPI001A9F0AD2|nr:TetR/AcrR family transcriptional regulator [Streptomyces sp. VRA16 Mangrove soil]MBO1331342.1 TetR/AcrR family transcriptional regulator [Streptomyces sp. VRA16 Mangrove soil]